MNNLFSLKKLLTKYNIDGYLVPKNDEYFQETSEPDRLKEITNFSGSAGIAIILKNTNLMFVDGRYTLQAKLETKNFNIYEIPKVSVIEILKKFRKRLNLGFDPKLFTKNSLERSFSDYCDLRPISENLTDLVCIKKNKVESNLIYKLNRNIVGEESKNKIKRLLKVIKQKKVDNIFISSIENVAWLLNIRCKKSNKFPIPECQLILCKSGIIYFISDIKNYLNFKKLNLGKKIIFQEKKNFLNIIKNTPGKSFAIDPNTCSIYFEKIISAHFDVKYNNDPCYLMKSVKNNYEIKNMVLSHIYDGVAITKFLFWLKNSQEKKNEIYAEKFLEKIRRKENKYLCPSFNTISACGPNGAIIHYRASQKTNRKFKKNDIYLCDSGGYYKYGTTDVTRTVCFGNPSLKIKELYTRVLKGHIAVANSRIDKFSCGADLDKKARYWLKKINLDYAHGTGHGVGFFSYVHEGPQSISKTNKIKLIPGMVLSNEPGYYKKNQYGIRLENLIFVKMKNKKKFFENLTLAPFDADMIDFRLLNKNELSYLYNYHNTVLNKIGKKLNFKEKEWLVNLTNNFI